MDIDGKTVLKFMDKDENSLKYFGKGKVSKCEDKDGNHVSYDVNGQLLFVNCKEEGSVSYSSDEMIGQSAIMQKKAKEAIKNAELVKENGRQLQMRVFDEFWDRTPSRDKIKADLQAMIPNSNNNQKGVAQSMRYDLAFERRAQEKVVENDKLPKRTRLSVEQLIEIRSRGGNLLG